MDDVTIEPVVVELAWSTRQVVLRCLAQFFWAPFLLAWMAWSVPKTWAEHGWVAVGFVVIAVAAYAGAGWLAVRRERASVLRLRPDGLYDGRRDGKRSPGGRPQLVPWDAIIDIRLIETRWRRTVVVYRPPALPLLLTLPRSTSFNPDPELDERLALIRRLWVERGAAFPPPPTASPPGWP